jgi:hypothetical protein
MSIEQIQGETKASCENGLSVKDWLDFLESRRNACITFIISVFVMTVILVGTILISIANGEVNSLGIIAVALGFCILVVCYILGVNLWGSPRKQASTCSWIIYRILSGGLKDPDSIRKEWKKYNSHFKSRPPK